MLCSCYSYIAITIVRVNHQRILQNIFGNGLQFSLVEYCNSQYVPTK